MLWIILSQILACTPWYNEIELAKIETPTTAKLVQSQQRFFWFSGSKVLFLPYIGCNGKIEVITEHDTRSINIKSNGGFTLLVQACPSKRSVELITNTDGTYLAYRLSASSDWIALQQTEAGLLPVILEPGFTGTPEDWLAVTNIENPVELLTEYEKQSTHTHRNPDTTKLLQVVATLPHPEQRDFLAESIETLKVDQWIAMFRTLDEPNQDALLDGLLSEFMTGTATMTIETYKTFDARQSGHDERIHMNRMLFIRERVLPLVDPSKHADFLKRVIDSEYLPKVDDFQMAHAKYWSVDPKYTVEQICPYIVNPDRYMGQAHTALAMVLIGDQDIECSEALKNLTDKAIQTHLTPCCDDTCVWESDLTPREAYIQQMQQAYVNIPDSTAARYYMESTDQHSESMEALNVAHVRLTYTVKYGEEDCIGVYEGGVSCNAPEDDVKEEACLQAVGPVEESLAFNSIIDDEAKTIQVQSTGRISEPKAMMTHVSASEENELQQDGYVCALYGQQPFYGLFNHWSIKWNVNGSEVSIDTSTSKDVLDSLFRNAQKGNSTEASQQTYLPASHYQSGDVLDCTLKVTKFEKPSLDKILATLSLGPSRTYVAESITVPW